MGRKTKKKSLSIDLSSWKVRFYIILFIWLATIVCGTVYFSNNGRLIIASTPFRANTHQAPMLGDLPISEGKCYKYGRLSTTFFVDEYVVQRGDTLLSIAKSKLGSTSRASEIVSLNHNLGLYPELSLEKPFVEVGWKLYIPPKDFPQTGGNIQAYAGEIESIEKDAFIIGFNGKGGGRVGISDDTIFMDKDRSDFNVGDCIFHIEDVRTGAGGVNEMYISTLTEDLLYSFKENISLKNFHSQDNSSVFAK